MTADSADEPMTRRDRDDLAKVARMRTKVAVAGIAEQQAALLADVEAQLSAIYRFDDEAWKDIVATAKEAAKVADAKVAALCEARGIRPEFRPGVNLGFYERGENAIAKRRTELRKAAQTRIDAAGKRAKTAIEARSLEVQTELIAGGLSGEAARSFLATIPTAEQLMPKMPLAEIEQARTDGLADQAHKLRGGW